MLRERHRRISTVDVSDLSRASTASVVGNPVVGVDRDKVLMTEPVITAVGGGFQFTLAGRNAHPLRMFVGYRGDRWLMSLCAPVNLAILVRPNLARNSPPALSGSC